MKQKSFSSRYKGVWKVKGGWRAAITINGKRTHLGYFKRELDAARAYERARNDF